MALQGRGVVTASQSGTVRLWALPSGVELCRAEGHRARVTACHVWEPAPKRSSKTGKKKQKCRVLTAAVDGSLDVWDVKIDERELRAAIANNSGRERPRLRAHDGGEEGGEEGGEAGALPGLREAAEELEEAEQEAAAAAEAAAHREEEARLAAAEAAAARVRARAGDGESVMAEVQRRAGVATSVPQRVSRAPRRLGALGDDGAEDGGGGGDSMYTVVVVRHPEFGLGMALGTDERNNAVIEGLGARRVSCCCCCCCCCCCGWAC